ncbi:MAG: hypothetical protein D3923_15905, partial [Candidatus Electrothrix sp. AR3]|nr:hypothetical protein [Candidatus Electrothrix sp. AR3]
EWCADTWLENLGKNEVTDPYNDGKGSNRVVRGGSWISHGEYVRSAFRARNSPGSRYHSYGFRLVSGHELRDYGVRQGTGTSLDKVGYSVGRYDVQGYPG